MENKLRFIDTNLRTVQAKTREKKKARGEKDKERGINRKEKIEFIICLCSIIKHSEDTSISSNVLSAQWMDCFSLKSFISCCFLPYPISRSTSYLYYISPSPFLTLSLSTTSSLSPFLSPLSPFIALSLPLSIYLSLITPILCLYIVFFLSFTIIFLSSTMYLLSSVLISYQMLA